MSINVGLVGYGLAGSIFHAPIIDSVPGLVLKTVVSSKATQIQRDFPQTTVAPSLERLLEDESIVLVVIATPNATHFPLAQQAIAAGKHVVIDKPFVLTSEQADMLIELADKQNVLLSPFQNRRWANDFLTVSQLLKSNTLGKLSSYEVHFDRFRPQVRDRWRERQEPGSGILYDLGSHLIDQALMLFGLPESLWANVQAQRPNAQTDDYFHLVLKYPEHTVILHSSSLIREPGPTFQIHGSEGSFIKYGMDPQEAALKAGQRPGNPGWGEDPEAAFGHLTLDIGSLEIKGRIKTLPGSYEAYYQQIKAAITDGAPLPVSAVEGRKTIRVIEAAFESSRQQCVIRI